MTFKDAPIQRKLVVIILLTSMAALLLMRSVFFTYEFFTFRQATQRQLSAVGKVIAANSSAALAFVNVDDAREILGALKAEPHLTAAALYDRNGLLFAKFPADFAADALPRAPEKSGYRFQHSVLVGFEPVMQGDRRLGTLYLRLDTGTMMAEWLRTSIGLGLMVIVVALAFSYVISKQLQKRISRPILALAETARAISSRRDYSVRAPKLGQDEFGLLTDAFNQMLSRIHEQNQAVSESEARVRAVLDSALSAVVVIDAAGVVIDWNSRAQSMFGWLRGEALGRELAEMIIPPQHREAHRRGVKHFLASGEGPVLNRLVELTALRRDGSEFPVELSISPLKRGDTVAFCGFITDITERKRAEERFRRVVESSPNAIVLVNVEGRITMVNAQTEKSFGYARAELVGQRIELLVPERFRARHPGYRGGFFAAPTARPMGVGRDLFGLRKDGSEFPIEIGLNPMETDEGMFVLASIIDITERKRMEEVRERFAVIVNSSEDAILSKTLDGRITSWNPGAEKLFGYSAEESVGQPMLLIVPPERAGEEPEILARVARGETIEHFETVRVRKNGQRIDVSVVISPLRDGRGQIIGASAIARDITDRKRAEQEILKLNEELERRVRDRTAQLEAVNKELEAFSYSVSHDLRAPLRHIDGFAKMLEQNANSTLDESGRRYLKIISDAVGRMGTLIDDLLVFSRMGRAEMRRTDVNATELVAEVLQEMVADLQGRKIKWDIAPLPVVNGDRAMLKQVWVNLLSNAVKYSRQRDIAEIKIRWHKNERGESEFSVQDNGAGFDMQYAGKLFGVFQRLHHAEEFEGTGIGLANVRRIVLRHGGRTWAEGKLDAGATFYFSLPDTERNKT